MATKESLTLTIAPPGAGPDDAHLKLTLTDMLKSDDIMHLKRTIAREIRRPAEWSQMTLYFTGIKLEDDQTLEHYGIQDVLIAPEVCLNGHQVTVNLGGRDHTGCAF